MKKRDVFIFVLLLSLFSCSDSLDRKHRQAMLKSPEALTAKMKLSHVKKNLAYQYTRWKGTKYRRGGLSKRGVDCSGLVYLTFLNRFGIQLPRETRAQARCGAKVSRKSLNIGDLVFFKTGFGRLHVGIYCGDNRFLHSSTKKGVIISSMSNAYWAARYWKARRLIRLRYS